MPSGASEPKGARPLPKGRTRAGGEAGGLLLVAGHERDGFVHRGAKPVIPPRVDYSLTSLGEKAAGQVWGPARWTGRRMGDVLKACERYDEVKAKARG